MEVVVTVLWVDEERVGGDVAIGPHKGAVAPEVDSRFTSGYVTVANGQF